MANHLQIPLQAKLFAILSGDATLVGLLASSSSFYDGVPDGAPFPYITLGEMSLADWSSHTHNGFSGYITIHAWSRAGGRLSSQTILSRVYQLLHGKDLGITGFPTINFRCSLNQVLVDPDGKTHHGVQRYDLIFGGN